MLKKITLWVVVCGLVVGCVSATPSPNAQTTPINMPPAPTDTAVPVPTDTVRPTATIPPLPTDTPVPTIPPLSTEELSIAPNDVTLYPIPFIAEGDRVTFQIRPHVPDVILPADVDIIIAIDEQPIITDTLDARIDLGNSTGLIKRWAWTAEKPGTYTVSIAIDPFDTLTIGDANQDDNIATFTVDVRPTAALSPIEQNAAWQTRETAFANIHFVSGTTADLDQELLVEAVDAGVQGAAAILDIIPNRKLDVYFIDRVIGQGGYAGGSIVISYPGRNYAGGSLEAVLLHESIHILDEALINGAEYRFWTEGLAVWGTGGHYKTENLDQRAAALLLESNRYIPLDILIDDFYPAQHEVGYLQAGAFVKYMVDNYGWDRMQSFYGNLQDTAEDQAPSDAISKTTAAYFGKTLQQLEQDWHSYLRAQPSSDDALDLELTIAYYDTIRAYQKQHDPTAYFLNAWLPSAEYMRENQLTGALTRHPEDEVNVVYETMLWSADQSLRAGNYDRVRSLLDSIELSLERDEFRDPLAASYLNLVRATASLGYEAQTITIADQAAIVEAAAPDSQQLITLQLALENQQWTVSQ